MRREIRMAGQRTGLTRSHARDRASETKTDWCEMRRWPGYRSARRTLLTHVLAALAPSSSHQPRAASQESHREIAGETAAMLVRPAGTTSRAGRTVSAAGGGRGGAGCGDETRALRRRQQGQRTASLRNSGGHSSLAVGGASGLFHIGSIHLLSSCAYLSTHRSLSCSPPPLTSPPLLSSAFARLPSQPQCGDTPPQLTTVWHASPLRRSRLGIPRSRLYHIHVLTKRCAPFLLLRPRRISLTLTLTQIRRKLVIVGDGTSLSVCFTLSSANLSSLPSSLCLSKLRSWSYVATPPACSPDHRGRCLRQLPGFA